MERFLKTLVVVWVSGYCCVEGGDTTEASAACGGSGSGSGTEDCPTPPPTSHLQTLLTWDCDGRVRILPDNPLFNVNLDIPMLPRMMQAGYESMFKYVEGQCAGITVTEDDFQSRYHPLSGALYGNRVYSINDIPNYDCLDSPGSFTRDLPKLFRALAGGSSFEMPTSCKHDAWSQKKDPLSLSESKRDPKCSFVHEFMEIGADIQVVAKRCENHRDFFKLSIGCSGYGCNIFKPCESDFHCNAKDHLVCADPFNWKDPKVKNSKPKYLEKDFYDWFKDNVYLYGKEFEDNECEDFYPAKLLKKFLAKFAAFIVDSPESLGGTTCNPNDPASVCKICLPSHTSAFETTVSDFPGRWREVSTEFPKSRYQEDKDGCALSVTHIKSNTSHLVGDTTTTASRNPTILAPVHPTDANQNPRFPAHADFFVQESPLVQGSTVPLQGSMIDIGGLACTDHNNCGTAGICVNKKDEYCELAQNECDKHAQCELDTTQKCVPVHSQANAPKACACFALDRTDPAAAKFTYGAACDKQSYISSVESSHLLDALYSETVHQWRSRYDPFIHWDGLASADGEDPFKERDHWAKFPDMQAPTGEKHLMSTQCDGVMHFFMQTPYHIRLHAPKLSELANFFTQFNYDTWVCRDVAQGFLGGDSKTFLVNQAIHRPEAHLFAKFVDKTNDNKYVRELESAGFKTLVRWLYNETSTDSDIFDVFNYNHVLQFSDLFTLTQWFQKGAIGTKYTGLRGMRNDGVETAATFSKDFGVNFRTSTCTDNPMGFVEMHLTCEGKQCDEMLYGTSCMGGAACDPDSACSSVFKQQYADDVVSQVLWGVTRTVQPGKLYTDDSLCPALETSGTNGKTMKEPGTAVKETSRLLWTNFRFPDCTKRQEATCWGHCSWVKDADLGVSKCIYPTGKDPVELPQQSDLMFCTPGKKMAVHPFMSETLYEAIVTQNGFDTHIGKNGDTAAATLLPNSANVYDQWNKFMRGSVSQHSIVFSFKNDAESISSTPLESESLYYTKEEEDSSAFGASFIAVVCVMLVIVCIAAICVWWHYIRKTKEEKTRLENLRGLQFEFKEDPGVYGRDLKLPEMYKRWLPGADVCTTTDFLF